MYYYLRQDGYFFGNVCSFVVFFCLSRLSHFPSVRQIVYKITNGFGDDPNHYPDTGSGLRSGYDPDRTDLHQTFTRSVSRVKDQFRIRITICNFGKGLQSLTDSLCSCVIQCLPYGDLNYQTTCALRLHDSCYRTLVSVHSYQIG